MSFFNSDDSIVALCTPSGISGGIAVIRISGGCSFEIVEKISQLSNKKKLSLCQSHTIQHGFIIKSSKETEIIDEVLFFLMRGPRTFTGNDTVEISCHNNSLIIEKIISLAVENGARPALRGEFTQQAVLNGKIDLIKAEAINELISCKTEMHLKKSLKTLKGSLSLELEKIEAKIISILSIIEADIEFSDQEDEPFAFGIKGQLEILIKTIGQICKSHNSQKYIKEGFRVAIIGSVNSGKSTLFNALIDSQRSIVTSTPGTTRDSVETSVFVRGNNYVLVDTAGIRKTRNEIEQMGIEQSWREANKADIVILVSDFTQKRISSEDDFYTCALKKYKDKIIFVSSKYDIWKDGTERKKSYSESIKISAQKKVGLSLLEKEIEKRITQITINNNSPFLLNKRQCNILLEIKIKLKETVKILSEQQQHEIAACLLRQSIQSLAKLTGKELTETILSEVFDSFCIGK
jgi:tRNA modification GTPase